jgi:hypothetical protein
MVSVWKATGVWTALTPPFHPSSNLLIHLSRLFPSLSPPAQVHYIIDYYYNPSGPAVAPVAASASGPAAAALTRSIHVDVRPAVEDVSSLLDRLRLFPQRALEALRRPRFFAEGIDPSKAPPPEVQAAAAANANLHGESGAGAGAAPASAAQAAGSSSGSSSGSSLWDSVDAKCGPLLEELKAAAGSGGGEEERRSKQVALNFCMGSILCPAQARDFLSVLEGNAAAGLAAGSAGGKEEEAFMAMTQCVVGQVAHRRQAASSSSSSSSKSAELR